MNAQELHQIVSKWPREAWPEGVTWNELLWDGKVTNANWVFDLCTLSVPHAVMLFESAGIKHYCRVCRYCPQIYIGSTGHWNFAGQCAPTLIQSISQAIESVNPKEVPSG